MRSLTSRFGSGLLSCFALVPLLQDNKDDNPQVADRINALKEAYKKKDDKQAVGAIDALTQLADKSGPKDRAKIATVLSASFEQRRDEVGLYRAAAASLSTMGEDGAKPLVDATANRNFKKPEQGYPELRSEFAKLAGKTRSVKAVDPLLALLNDKDYVVIAGAAEGLGNYRKAEESVRKKIVEQLTKLVVTAEANKTASPNDADAKLKYDTIGGAIITTLQTVTGENLREPAEWMKWWNTNKKATWKPLT